MPLGRSSRGSTTQHQPFGPALEADARTDRQQPRGSDGMTDSEFDRTARAWLEDGPNEISDRALQAALDEIHVTRQRRAWWPARRQTPMFTMIRVAAAREQSCSPSSVSVSCLRAEDRGRPPTPTPRLTDATCSTVDNPWPSLEAGTYVTADPFLSRVTFTAARWLARKHGWAKCRVSECSLKARGELNFFDIRKGVRRSM